MVAPAGPTQLRRRVAGRFQNLPRNSVSHCAFDVQFHGRLGRHFHATERPMNSIIYLVGLVVVVMAVLSLIGIH